MIASGDEREQLQLVVKWFSHRKADKVPKVSPPSRDYGHTTNERPGVERTITPILDKSPCEGAQVFYGEGEEE
jgi:hypothetical protein